MKLHNSEYVWEQIRRIPLSGIKGYTAKKTRCEKGGSNLRRTAMESEGASNKAKLLGQSKFKKRCCYENDTGSTDMRIAEQKETKTPPLRPQLHRPVLSSLWSRQQMGSWQSD